MLGVCTNTEETTYTAAKIFPASLTAVTLHTHPWRGDSVPRTEIVRFVDAQRCDSPHIYIYIFFNDLGPTKKVRLWALTDR